MIERQSRNLILYGMGVGNYFLCTINISRSVKEIGICKYIEMLMATVKDALEILRYGSSERIESEIFGIAQK